MSQASPLSTEDDEPLVYREVLARGRRTFELFPDRVFIKVRYPNYSAEVTVLLADLRPNPNIVYQREWPFQVGIVLLAGAAIMGIYAFSLPDKAINYLSTRALPFAIVGGVMFFYSFRKIMVTSFVSHLGIALLDVADAGPDRRQYHDFLTELQARVTANQNKASQPTDA